MGIVMDGGGGLGKYYLGLGFDCENGTLALWDRDCFIFCCVDISITTSREYRSQYLLKYIKSKVHIVNSIFCRY